MTEYVRRAGFTVNAVVTRKPYDFEFPSTRVYISPAHPLAFDCGHAGARSAYRTRRRGLRLAADAFVDMQRAVAAADQIEGTFR